MRRLTIAVDIDGTITENRGERIHLDALLSLRTVVDAGHNVIFVTGRSSIEGYILAVFGGMTKFCIGENGGCITFGDYTHKLLGKKLECITALKYLQNNMDNVKEKPVFQRMTEVVLERTFEIKHAVKLLDDAGYKVLLTDSQYAFHINSQGIDKGSGLRKAMRMLTVDPKDVIAIGDSATDVPMFAIAETSVALGNATEYVRSKASLTVDSKAGDGLIEVMDMIGPQMAGTIQ
ncbi:MAG: phosphoglycolate phosphatase [Cenarchaeum symbiont of Oopsacas minuta]|nr:phosphoglycolate phosphatase [Cenarchaeum symbiont of Oopsacas minuta]